MTRVETAYDSEDATRLAQVALEFDPAVREYERVETGDVSFVVVTATDGDGPICVHCGSQFGTRSSCPTCGEPRVGANTTPAPARFTVTITEVDTGSIIITSQAELAESTLAIEEHTQFLDIVRGLRDNHETIEAVESELLKEKGGYTKHGTSDQSAERAQQSRSNPSEGEIALDLIKISIILGVLGAGLVLGFAVMTG